MILKIIFERLIQYDIKMKSLKNDDIIENVYINMYIFKRNYEIFEAAETRENDPILIEINYYNYSV